jgi:hypothetical protein
MTSLLMLSAMILGFGDDVVYNHGLAGIGFGCLAISATVIVYFNQLLA